MTTARKLIKGSLRLINAIGTNEEPSPDDMDTAIDALNGMVDSFSTDLLNIHKFNRVYFPFEGGKGEYTMGPSANSDWITERPMRIEQIKVLKGQMIGTATTIDTGGGGGGGGGGSNNVTEEVIQVVKFQDEWLGPAGTMDGHSPDISPQPVSWFTGNETYNLDGNGVMKATLGGFGASGASLSNFGELPVFVLSDITEIQYNIQIPDAYDEGFPGNCWGYLWVRGGGYNNSSNVESNSHGMFLELDRRNGTFENQITLTYVASNTVSNTVTVPYTFKDDYTTFRVVATPGTISLYDEQTFVTSITLPDFDGKMQFQKGITFPTAGADITLIMSIVPEIYSIDSKFLRMLGDETVLVPIANT